VRFNFFGFFGRFNKKKLIGLERKGIKKSARKGAVKEQISRRELSKVSKKSK